MSEHELRQEIAELRAQVDELDEWANSLHVALRHVALQLAHGSPQAAAGLLAVLEHDARRCDQLEAGSMEPTDSADSPELLESSRLLYRELGSSLRHLARKQSAPHENGS